ncbi:MAG: magnesium transporter [Chloroflexi bacterium]|nr:magnesium transporter [Chloroflexota bacterium]
MVMLSALRRHRLVDSRGHSARVTDVAVDLSVGDYPLVTRVLYRHKGHGAMAIPWADVVNTNWRNQRIQVKDLDAGRAAPAASLRRTVLLGRDVLDALILDVAAAQAMRANDLWLREEQGELKLCAADASPWAVLRRLARGLLGNGAERRLVDWKNLEFLRGDPQAARSGGDYHRRITRLPPVTIAQLATAVPYRHAAELLTLLPDPVAADTLEAMTAERQRQVFETLDEGQSVRLLALMAPDTATDLVGRLPPDEARWFLERLPPDSAQRVIELLRYPEDTAGGIMTNDVPVVPAGITIGEARSGLREHLRAPDFVYYVYAVADLETRRLEGVFSLRDLLVNDESRLLTEIMQHDVLAVDPLEPAVQAARQVCELHLAALPVVGRDRRLLGAVTVDTALAHIAPAAWRDQTIRIFS